MDLDEHSEYYALFVGAAEWTHGPTEQDDNYELYVEVKVDDSREVHRTMSTVTAQWNQVIRIAGHLSSIVSIEIKGSLHNSSESLSIARAGTSLGNLLKICADGDGDS
ncbi:hypothetical protein FIBSPDRAFT_941298 [Athelia psychrophila]|uniref:C2 domain-containing protein n=1 Tax=Athelia psychrophila TaxID=1759441 RepID=A0A167UEI7_9AGAM|nr:hypothetical protein FIBSPDRAFT_941298 [Fibularhizoctonia sp. CBS 109695]